MLKSITTFTAIIAVILAQAQTEFPKIDVNYPTKAPTQIPRDPRIPSDHDNINPNIVFPIEHPKAPVRLIEPINGVVIPTRDYNESPITSACFNSIKATLVHVKSMAKKFDKAGGLGQLTEALEIFSEGRSAQNACAEVSFADLAKYAAHQKFEGTDLCLENVKDLQEKVAILFKDIKNTNSLTKTLSVIATVSKDVKATYKECKKIRKVVNF